MIEYIDIYFFKIILKYSIKILHIFLNGNTKI